jgi:hypothetical protein
MASANVATNWKRLISVLIEYFARTYIRRTNNNTSETLISVLIEYFVGRTLRVEQNSGESEESEHGLEASPLSILLIAFDWGGEGGVVHAMAAKYGMGCTYHGCRSCLPWKVSSCRAYTIVEFGRWFVSSVGAGRGRTSARAGVGKVVGRVHARAGLVGAPRGRMREWGSAGVRCMPWLPNMEWTHIPWTWISPFMESLTVSRLHHSRVWKVICIEWRRGEGSGEGRGRARLWATCMLEAKLVGVSRGRV